MTQAGTRGTEYPSRLTVAALLPVQVSSIYLTADAELLLFDLA